MTMDEIRALSDEELLTLCETRNTGKRKCYTADALKAQRIWNERIHVHCGFSSRGTNPHIWDGYWDE